MWRACAAVGLGLSTLLLLAAANSARAQALGAEGAAPAAREELANSIVFYAPYTLEPELRSALEDALHAQLMQLPAELRLELNEGPAEQVETRMDQLTERAREYSALAVFWLEVRSPSRWNLYAVDPRAERVAVRPVNVKPRSPEAALESVALIVRATAAALLRGEALPAESPVESPQPATADAKERPPWPVVPAFEPRSALRIAASYTGTTFARRLPWQHGLALRAAWIWPSGSYLGAGYTFFGRAEFQRDVTFQIDRYPIALFAGLRFPVDHFTFTGELGAEIDLRNRYTPDAPGLMAFGPKRRIVYSVCPKLEAEYSLTSWLRIFVNSGLDFLLNSFPYVLYFDMEGTQQKTVVEPHWLRLTAQIGVGIIR